MKSALAPMNNATVNAIGRALFANSSIVRRLDERTADQALAADAIVR